MLYAVIGVVVIIVVAVVALYAAGYFGGGTKTVNITINDPGSCTTGSATCNFSPASYSAHVGDTVTWKDAGTTPEGHTVTFPDPSFASGSVSSSQTVSPGNTVSVTFSSAGTFHYYCTIHTWMKGNVTVT